MNIENIRKAIAIMKRVDPKYFSMNYWQTPTVDGAARTTEELAWRRLSASFGGYVAVSSEFRADGGGARIVDGAPYVASGGQLYSETEAIAFWLGVPHESARKLETDPRLYLVPLQDVRPEDVIKALEEMIKQYEFEQLPDSEKDYRKEALRRYVALKEPNISHGICGRMTVGYGKLDQNGYSGFPLLP